MTGDVLGTCPELRVLDVASSFDEARERQKSAVLTSPLRTRHQHGRMSDPHRGETSAG